MKETKKGLKPLIDGALSKLEPLDIAERQRLVSVLDRLAAVAAKKYLAHPAAMLRSKFPTYYSFYVAEVVNTYDAATKRVKSDIVRQYVPDA